MLTAFLGKLSKGLDGYHDRSAAIRGISRTGYKHSIPGNRRIYHYYSALLVWLAEVGRIVITDWGFLIYLAAIGFAVLASWAAMQ